MFGRLIIHIIAAIMFSKQQHLKTLDLYKAKIARENAETARLQAAQENEQQQALSHRAKRITSHFNTLRNFVLPGMVAYGLSIAFIYCYLEIQFFPSGLSIAESIIFLFLAFGFGLFSVAFLAVGFINLIPATIHSGIVFQTKNKDKDKDKDKDKKDDQNSFIILAISILSPFLASGLLYFVYKENIFEIVFQAYHIWANLIISLISGILVAIAMPALLSEDTFKKTFKESWPLALANGFFSMFLIPWALFFLSDYGYLLLTVASLCGLSAWFALDLMTMSSRTVAAAGSPAMLENASRKESRIYVSLIMLMLTPLLVVSMDLWGDVRLSSQVFTRFGFRTELATVRAKGEALASLYDESNRSGIQLNFCLEKDGSATVSPVDLLWHGMGERSLLRVGHTKPTENNMPRERGGELEVNSKEIKLIRNTTTACRDIQTPILFRSHNHLASSPDLLDEEMRSLLKSMIPDSDTIKEKQGPRWRLDQVIVNGHADSMRLSDDGNEALSRRRAACVATQLVEKSLGVERRPQDDFKLEITGSGSREQAAIGCSAEQKGEQRIECETPNRKVTVRLMLACEQWESEKHGWIASNQCWRQARPPFNPGKQDKLQGTGHGRHAQSYADAKMLCSKYPSSKFD